MAALIASTAIVVVGGSDAFASCGRADGSCGGNVAPPAQPAPSPSPCGGGGCQPSVPAPGTPGQNGFNGAPGANGQNGFNGAPGANGQNG
ncbi:MAG: hypothetical protein EAZ74_02275, partial [Alphaproteobacteria bacterium]